MSKKLNIAYLATFQKMYLTKDVFLIPYYIAREQHVPLKVVYGSNQGDVELPQSYRGVELVGYPRNEVSRANEIIDWVRNILPHARHINSLFFCGCSFHHMLLTWILLKLNPKITVAVFGDMEEQQAQEFLETGTVNGKGIKAWFKRKYATFFFKHVKFLVANERACKVIRKAYQKYNWHGLASFYPCLDDELFYHFGLRMHSWSEKENIMISVGRIGNSQKNTDMLLDALGKVDLKDWKIFLIGPVTNNFKLGIKTDYEEKINDFYRHHPQQKDKVIFTGMIYDQKVIFNYYLRAKVYISSARHEGFANVYSQAAACGCYIVSTDVGGALTASGNWIFGEKLEQEDSEGLANVIQAIVNDVSIIDSTKRLPIDSFLYSCQIKKLIQNMDKPHSNLSM